MSPQDFLAIAIPAAQKAQAATRIPASITIAQAALESGWLNHIPPGSFNPFGIKANAAQIAAGQFVTSMTAEVLAGVRRLLPQQFAKYASLDDAFAARSQMILTRPWFAGALQHNDNALDFITALQSGKYKYSTDPYYVKAVMSIVDQYHLTKYDSIRTVQA